MFKVQARRLLRTVWHTPQKLAQELFAILSSDGPLEHKGTITLRPDGDQPIIRIPIPGDVPAGNVIEIVRETPTGYDPDPVGTYPFTGGGGGSPVPDPTDSGGTAGTETDPTAMPFATVGVVVSGSGASYTCNVWLTAPGASGANGYWAQVPVTVLGIDAAADIPDGTYIPVYGYYTSSTAVSCYSVVPLAL